MRGDLAAAAAQVEASGILGRSRSVIELFRYLVARSVEPRAPREIDIALDVFGRSASHDPATDSAVRVNVHRLREKLKAYARGPGAGDAVHLVLPPGDYRIQLAPSSPGAAVAPGTAPAGWRWRALAIACALLAAAAGGLAYGRLGASAPALGNPLWRSFAVSSRPLLLVVGDYYILGESDDGLEIARLVREYGINSPRDLDRYLMEHPEQQSRYRDLGLSYLPTSSAAAVRDVTDLFAGRKIAKVVLASEFTVDQLKDHDIIYVGYLSGLGALRETVFAGSRFAAGDTYDDITDKVAGRPYASQGGLGPARDTDYRDYGYVAFFKGPGGSRIAILAGARDIAAAAVADRLTDPAEARALTHAGSPAGVEALYEVVGHGTVDLATRRLIAAPRRANTD